MEDARSLDKDSAPKYTWTSVDSYALWYSVFSFICKPEFSFFFFLNVLDLAKSLTLWIYTKAKKNWFKVFSRARKCCRSPAIHWIDRITLAFMNQTCNMEPGLELDLTFQKSKAHSIHLLFYFHFIMKEGKKRKNLINSLYKISWTGEWGPTSPLTCLEVHSPVPLHTCSLVSTTAEKMKVNTFL